MQTNLLARFCDRGIIEVLTLDELLPEEQRFQLKGIRDRLLQKNRSPNEDLLPDASNQHSLPPLTTGWYGVEPGQAWPIRDYCQDGSSLILEFSEDTGIRVDPESVQIESVSAERSPTFELFDSPIALDKGGSPVPLEDGRLGEDLLNPVRCLFRYYSELAFWERIVENHLDVSARLRYSEWLNRNDDPHVWVFQATHPFLDDSVKLSWSVAVQSVEVGPHIYPQPLWRFARTTGLGRCILFTLADGRPVPQFIAYLIGVSRIRAEARINEVERGMLTVQARAVGMYLKADMLLLADGKPICRVNKPVQTLYLLGEAMGQDSTLTQAELVARLQEENMTEPEWETTSDIGTILRILRGRITQGQSRSLICRLICGASPNLLVAERYARGEATWNDLFAAAQAERTRLGNLIFSTYEIPPLVDFRPYSYLLIPFAGINAENPVLATDEDLLSAFSSRTGSLTDSDACDRIRDLIGNPYRKLEIDPACLTSTVLSLARQIHDSGDFSTMPILADALQDADCRDDYLLCHCRANTVHGADCWVVQLVLGKETFLQSRMDNTPSRSPATMDPLTGVGNPRAFRLALDSEVRRAVSTQSALSVLMINLDLFRQFNSYFTFLVGDHVLREVAPQLRSALRPSDVLARDDYEYKGDAFTALLPDTDLAEALVIGERVRSAVADWQWEYEGRSGHVTVSIGAATLDPSEPNAARLLEAAWEALMQAKDAGRNRVSR